MHMAQMMRVMQVIVCGTQHLRFTHANNVIGRDDVRDAGATSSCASILVILVMLVMLVVLVMLVMLAMFWLQRFEGSQGYTQTPNQSSLIVCLPSNQKEE